MIANLSRSIEVCKGDVITQQVNYLDEINVFFHGFRPILSLYFHHQNIYLMPFVRLVETL